MILLQAGAGGELNLVVLAVMAVFMIFFVLLPQSQRKKKQKQFIENLKKGDLVVTSGGIHGRMVGTEGNTIKMEIDRGVVIQVTRDFISAENTIPGKK